MHFGVRVEPLEKGTDRDVVVPHVRERDDTLLVHRVLLSFRAVIMSKKLSSRVARPSWL